MHLCLTSSNVLVFPPRLHNINITFLPFLFFLFRLKGLEQVTKATMLGHLLPVLLTSLMHPNLQTLTLADALMPQLVQLVLYTSQVGVFDTIPRFKQNV